MTEKQRRPGLADSLVSLLYELASLTSRVEICPVRGPARGGDHRACSPFICISGLHPPRVRSKRVYTLFENPNAIELNKEEEKLTVQMT